MTDLDSGTEARQRRILSVQVRPTPAIRVVAAKENARMEDDVEARLDRILRKQGASRARVLLERLEDIGRCDSDSVIRMVSTAAHSRTAREISDRGDLLFGLLTELSGIDGDLAGTATLFALLESKLKGAGDFAKEELLKLRLGTLAAYLSSSVTNFRRAPWSEDALPIFLGTDRMTPGGEITAYVADRVARSPHDLWRVVTDENYDVSDCLYPEAALCVHAIRSHCQPVLALLGPALSHPEPFGKPTVADAIAQYRQGQRQGPFSSHRFSDTLDFLSAFDNPTSALLHKGSQGRNGLHLLATLNAVDISNKLPVLLQHGLDPNALDEDGRTTLDILRISQLNADATHVPAWELVVRAYQARAAIGTLLDPTAHRAGAAMDR